jgi:hypothetical protein
MKKTHRLTFISLLIALLLAGCANNPTEDWKAFQIEEEPALDITFRLPPEWYVDYAPVPDRPGEWNIALVPPMCAEDQETEYEDNCVSLTAQIKSLTDFDKEDFLALVSSSMTLNQSQTEESVLISQTKFEVGGLDMERFNHKVFIGDSEVLLTVIFFETDSAFYYFVAEFPYEEREGPITDRFNLMVESIQETN